MELSLVETTFLESHGIIKVVFEGNTVKINDEKKFPQDEFIALVKSRCADINSAIAAYNTYRGVVDTYFVRDELTYIEVSTLHAYYSASVFPALRKLLIYVDFDRIFKDNKADAMELVEFIVEMPEKFANLINIDGFIDMFICQKLSERNEAIYQHIIKNITKAADSSLILLVSTMGKNTPKEVVDEIMKRPPTANSYLISRFLGK